MPTEPDSATAHSKNRASLFAVAAVCIAALAAALTAVRDGAPDAPPAAAPLAASPVTQGVVQAPPLKAPGSSAANSSIAAGSASTAVGAARSAMGAAAGCGNCGVVQQVVAVHGYARPTASGYLMHIRMDDGSVRTVEQRGALAAGSRVVVERGSVRLLTPP